MGAATIAAVLIPCAPAFAQPAGPPPNARGQNDLCEISTHDGAANEPKQLLATCRGRILLLGPVSEFEVLVSQPLQATLIDAHFGPERRILLLSNQAGENPVLENLTNQLTIAAGRGPASSLDGVELDLTTFAPRGEIGVRGRPEDTAPGRTDKVNLGQQIARTRAQVGVHGPNEAQSN